MVDNVKDNVDNDNVDFKDKVDPKAPYQGTVVEDATANLVAHRDPITGGQAVTNLDTGVTQTVSTARVPQKLGISLEQFLTTELGNNRNQMTLIVSRGAGGLINFTIRSKDGAGPALDFELNGANPVCTTLANV